MTGKQRPPADPCLVCGKGEHRGRYHMQLSHPRFHLFRSTHETARAFAWRAIALFGTQRLISDLDAYDGEEFGWVREVASALVPLDVFRKHLVDAIAAVDRMARYEPSGANVDVDAPYRPKPRKARR
jgi:hypothetical protein